MPRRTRLPRRSRPGRGKTRLVAIVGRVFTKAENYRVAAERAAAGDWSRFSPTELFENVLLTGSTANLNRAAEDLENLSDEQKTALFENSVNAPVNENIGDEVQAEAAGTEIKGAKTETEKTSQADEIAKLVEKFHNATAQKTTLAAAFSLKKTPKKPKRLPNGARCSALC